MEDFAPTIIPTRSFFAGEYLRLAKEIRLSLGHTENGEYMREHSRSVTLAMGTPVEYLYDVHRPSLRGSQLYHECQWTDTGGTSYVLHLTPDEIEVVRPI